MRPFIIKRIEGARYRLVEQRVLEHFVANVETYKAARREGWSHSMALGHAKISQEAFNKLAILDLEAWIMKQDYLNRGRVWL